jgi:MFS transporter, ACS family, glucarate transporter
MFARRFWKVHSEMPAADTHSRGLSPVPTRIRFGVLGFACALSMITYLDRVSFSHIVPELREFGFTNTQRGLLFSAFTFAYAAFEVPSGWLGIWFGPRKTLIRIVLWWSLFTALTGCVFNFSWDSGYRFHAAWAGIDVPLIVNGFLVMLTVRFLFGMGEAGAYPNISLAFHNWFPSNERGRIQGAVWCAGRFAGGATPFFISSLLIPLAADDPSQGHYWRHTFWIFGAIGVVWCVAFGWWFRDRPEQKAGVNQAELELIQSKENEKETETHRIPWLRLMASRNLWCLCLMYFCGAYGWYFNITYLASHLQEQYKVTTSTAGFWTYNALAGSPLLAGSIACLVGGLLSDWFIRLTGNRRWGRSLFGILGHGMCACCYVAAMYAHDAVVFVGAVALAAFCNDLTMGPAWATCLDIGKKYSGIVAGCMNTVGNFGGAVAGVLTGLILDRFANPPEKGWQINLASFAAVYFVAALLWLYIDATKPVVPEKT